MAGVAVNAAVLLAAMLLLGSADAQQTDTKAALVHGIEIADTCLAKNDGGTCLIFGMMEFLDTPAGNLIKAGYYWALWTQVSKTVFERLSKKEESSLDFDTRTGRSSWQSIAMVYAAMDNAAHEAGLTPPTICSTLGRDDCDKLNTLTATIEQNRAKAKAKENKQTGQPEISLNDLVREQVSRCWNMPAGTRDARDLVVEIRIHVNLDGVVEQATVVDQSRLADPFFRAFAESARSAFFNPICRPLHLPREQFPTAKDLIVKFSPKDIL